MSQFANFIKMQVLAVCGTSGVVPNYGYESASHCRQLSTIFRQRLKLTTTLLTILSKKLSFERPALQFILRNILPLLFITVEKATLNFSDLIRNDDLSRLKVYTVTPSLPPLESMRVHNNVARWLKILQNNSIGVASNILLAEENWWPYCPNFDQK